MNTTTMLLAGGITLAGLGLIGIIAALIFGDRLGHQGADEDYAVELHDMTAEPGLYRSAAWHDLVHPEGRHVGDQTADTPVAYVSRHHHDTVAIVTGPHHPLYSPAFAAVMGYDQEATPND